MNKTDLADKLTFASRQAFRDWLFTHVHDNGIWIIGPKQGQFPSITYAEALEEALCFGWIDGIVKRIDDATYMRYFSPRRNGSFFSKKNRDTITHLIKEGRMTSYGQVAIDYAKAHARYEEDTRVDQTLEATLLAKLKEKEPAYQNLMVLGKFSYRAYVGYYISAKLEATRIKRLDRIIERLIAKYPLP